MTDVQTSGGELPAIEGIDWRLAQNYQPDTKLLLDTVKNFWNACERRAEELQAFYEASDGEHYRIAVHSMKSAAAMIGADALSQRAKALEMAAGGGQWDVVTADTEEFLREWLACKDRLAALFDDETFEKRPIDDTDVVVGYLDALRGAMEEFDIGRADEMMEQLRQYRFDGRAGEQFLRLDRAVMDFDSDAVGEAAGKLMDLILERQ